MSAGVELIDIAKYFGDHCAVDHISFAVEPGKFFSLLGPSGCGKSTTLRMISGFETADTGEIRIGGEDVGSMAPYRRPTNMVFQRWALFPHMTAAQNVAFGLEVDRVSRQEVRSRVADMLDLVDLASFAGRKPGQLSGGQMQRVALARALIKRPKVLLLDEPLGALDLKLRHQMQRELKQIQRQIGTTFIFVTHDQNEAVTMSDSIAVMNDGRIEQIGAPLEIYDRPRTRFVAHFIGNTNMLPVAAKSRSGSRANVAAGDLTFECIDECSGTGGPGTGHVSLRYEQVKLEDAAQGLPVTVDATIANTVFSGSVVQYELAVEGHDLKLIAELHHDGGAPILQDGQKVRAGWAVESARFFADD